MGHGRSPRPLVPPPSVTSNVVLRVDGTLCGVANRSAYPKIGFLPSYGHDLDTGGPARRQPLVFAVGASNISIVGGGVIDGNGWYWYPEFRNHSLDPGVGRPHLVEFQNCTGVEVTGITLLNPAFWTMHPGGGATRRALSAEARTGPLHLLLLGSVLPKRAHSQHDDLRSVVPKLRLRKHRRDRCRQQQRRRHRAQCD